MEWLIFLGIFLLTFPLDKYVFKMGYYYKSPLDED